MATTTETPRQRILAELKRLTSLARRMEAIGSKADNEHEQINVLLEKLEQCGSS